MSAWGDSWGSSWGVSWGDIGIAVVVVGSSGGILSSQGLSKLHPDDRDLLDLIIIIDLSND